MKKPGGYEGSRRQANHFHNRTQGGNMASVPNPNSNRQIAKMGRQEEIRKALEVREDDCDESFQGSDKPPLVNDSSVTHSDPIELQYGIDDSGKIEFKNGDVSKMIGEALFRGYISHNYLENIIVALRQEGGRVFLIEGEEKPKYDLFIPNGPEGEVITVNLLSNGTVKDEQGEEIGHAIWFHDGGEIRIRRNGKLLIYLYPASDASKE